MHWIKTTDEIVTKAGDTSTIMHFILCGYPVSISDEHAILSVKNDTNYLMDIDIQVENNHFELDFGHPSLSQLPAGTYYIEVSAHDGGDIAKFPTNGFFQFTLNENIYAQPGKLVPQITFESILQKVEKEIANKVGPSNYDIAVKNGFTGTEQEWLATLKGDKGDQGPKGDRGEKGEKG
ncbi:hypothetical protein KAR63_03360, partial [Weissella uvarum]|nr:hypothetical protein [Weissella uvarum]